MRIFIAAAGAARDHSNRVLTTVELFGSHIDRQIGVWYRLTGRLRVLLPSETERAQGHQVNACFSRFGLTQVQIRLVNFFTRINHLPSFTIGRLIASV